MSQSRARRIVVAVAIIACPVPALGQSQPPKASFGPTPAPAQAAAPVAEAPAPAVTAAPPVAPAPAAQPAPPVAQPPVAPPAVASPPPPATTPVATGAPIELPGTYTAPAALPPCTARSTPSPCLQPPSAYHHDGFYLRLSTGPHYAAFAGDGQGTDVNVHGLTSATMLAIGGTPGDGFVVAGAFRAEELRGTLHGPAKGGKATAALGQLGLLMDWYPRPSDGWHAGGLLALGVVSLTDSALSDSSGAAFSASIFGGYDFWIGPEWSLGLLANFSASTRASLKDSNMNGTGYELNALSAGLELAFTLH